MNEYLVNVLTTVQGVTVLVELLASDLKLLFIESEEMTLTRVNPCVIMAKLLGRYDIFCTLDCLMIMHSKLPNKHLYSTHHCFNTVTPWAFDLALSNNSDR